MPNFQQLPSDIRLEIYSFFSRREVLSRLSLVNKELAEFSKNKLVKKQILIEIGPDLNLLRQKEETLTETFDRNKRLLTIIQHKVIDLLTKRFCKDLTVEEQKILPYFHAHCVLPNEIFLKRFSNQNLLKSDTKKYPYLKDLIIKCLLLNFCHVVKHVSTLKMICEFFSEHKEIVIQTCLRDELLMENVFFNAYSVNLFINYFPEFRVEVMNVLAKSQKHISRIVNNVFDVEMILSKASEFAKEVLKTIVKDNDLFGRVFDHQSKVDRLKESIAADLCEQVQIVFSQASLPELERTLISP